MCAVILVRLKHPYRPETSCVVLQPYWTPFWQLAVGALGLAMFAVAYTEPSVSSSSSRPATNASQPAQRVAQVHPALFKCITSRRTCASWILDESVASRSCTLNLTLGSDQAQRE